MLGSSEVIAFIATKDLNRARTFYEEALGLHLVESNPNALVFETNGRMLRITLVDSLTPANHTVVGWEVADIEAMAAEFDGRGIVFERYPMLEQDDQGICTFPNGDRVAWFKDPDGNTLSISQTAPSE